MKFAFSGLSAAFLLAAALFSGSAVARAQTPGQSANCPLNTVPKIVSASTYTLSSADKCQWVILTNPGGVTVTLPAPGLIFPPEFSTTFLPTAGGAIAFVGKRDQAGALHLVNSSPSLVLAAGSGAQIKALQDMNWWVATLGGSGNGIVPSVADNATLKGLSGGIYPVVYRQGYFLAGDGGAATYIWNAASTCTDDGGSCVQPSVGTGRWLAVFSDETDVRVFGAKCDGTTDDSAAVQAADAATVSRLGINATCRLSNNVTLSHPIHVAKTGALSVDSGKTLTLTSATIDAAAAFPGVGTIAYGSATTQLNNVKTATVNYQTWLEAYIPPSTSLSQTASFASPLNPSVGGIGVTGAARASDFSGASANVYGLAGFAINDHPTNATLAWGGLFIATRKTAAPMFTLGIEVESPNAVNSIVDTAPFTMFPSGLTAGVWIAPSPCSFPAGSGICASPTYNTSAAVGIVGNGAVLKTVTTHSNTTLDGIADTTAIVVTGPVNGECIPAGSTVSSKAANSVVISNAATCSTTETVNFSSVHRKGIVFDGWGLDPSTGPTGTVGIAMELAMKQAVRWVDGSNNPLMTVHTDASGVLQFIGSNVRLKNSANAAERIELDSGLNAAQLTYTRYSDQGLPWFDVGKNASNQFEIKNVQTGKIDLRFDTADVMTLPNLGSVAAGTAKRFLCIDTVTKIVYEGSGASCN